MIEWLGMWGYYLGVVGFNLAVIGVSVAIFRAYLSLKLVKAEAAALFLVLEEGSEQQRKISEEICKLSERQRDLFIFGGGDW